MFEFITSFFASSLFLVVLIGVEVLFRRFNLCADLTRRFSHFLSGVFAITMGLSFNSNIFIFWVSVFIVVIVASRFFKIFKSIHNVDRVTFGEFLFPIGILVCYLISGQSLIFIVSVLILSISDPIASTIGNSKFFGKNKWVGSAAFLVSGFVIMFIFFSDQSLTSIFFITFLVTLVERYSKYGADNFTIPNSAAILMMVFNF